MSERLDDRIANVKANMELLDKKESNNNNGEAFEISIFPEERSGKSNGKNVDKENRR